MSYPAARIQLSPAQSSGPRESHAAGYVSNVPSTDSDAEYYNRCAAWRPFDIPEPRTDFVEGLKTLAGNGDPTLREGLAVHIYAANASMEKKAFVNNDGDMLMVPSQGRLDIQTEFGK